MTAERVNGFPDVPDRYPRFTDRHTIELRKGCSNSTHDGKKAIQHVIDVMSKGLPWGTPYKRFNRDDVRIARATRSRARITLTSDIEAVINENMRIEADHRRRCISLRVQYCRYKRPTRAIF